MKIRLPAMVILALAAVPLCGDQPATRTVSVEVHAPDHKPNGKPWDVNPMIILPIFLSPMDSVGNPNPDMMLCVIDASGASNCIHDTRVNHWGVPYSICRDSLVCDFTNVKVPSAGYFGLLIIDLDWLPESQDYMLGAVMRNGGPEVPSEAWKIEKFLKTLIQKWHAVGAPDEFPEAPVAECTLKDPCFGSASRGIPSVAISSQEVRPCGMPGSRTGSVEFRFNAKENQCTSGVGVTEYIWQFGDGSTAATREPNSEHNYRSGGAYDVKITPHCIRKLSVCEAAPATVHLTIAP
jgi:hypothetical protein